MKLRINRKHLTGTSNVDYRTNDNPKFYPDNYIIENLSLPKSKKFDEIIRQKLSRTIPTPLSDTQKFYKEIGKQTKEKLEISKCRSSHLEEKDKMKRVFTGESNTIYQNNYIESNKFENQKKTIDQLIQFKYDANAKAIQETQLIGMEKYSHETLEGKVNLEKIREIRRALRRRYANRKNIFNIFSNWDKESKGNINLINVFEMINNMGLNINVNEAQVLIASADRDNSSALTLDEFMDLIYNNNDVLNVDLKKLPYIDEEDFKKPENREKTVEFLSKDARDAREELHRNQLKLILKNRIQPIAHKFLLLDEKKLGFIPVSIFADTMKNLKIGDQLCRKEDIDRIAQKYSGKDGHFDYKQFCIDIRDYDFNLEQAYKYDQEAVIKKRNTKAEIMKQIRLFNQKNQKDENVVVDCQKQPINLLEQIRLDMRKVNRQIKRIFPKKKQFIDFLHLTFNPDNQQQSDEKQINKQELKLAFQKLFGENQ